MSIFDKIALPVEEAARLAAWRLVQWAAVCWAYRARPQAKGRDGRVHFVTGVPLDFRIDPERDYGGEVDMVAFAAWLRGHGLLDVSVTEMRSLYLEFAFLSERRAVSAKCMYFALGSAGIVSYRPRLKNGDRVTRYAVRVLEVDEPVPIAKGRKHRSIADVSTVSGRPMKRAA